MSSAEADPAGPKAERDSDITDLIPILTKFVNSRVSNPEIAEDLVQEALVKVLAAINRVEPEMLEPYAIATARNLIASMWKEHARDQRNQHRVVDLLPSKPPDEELLKREDSAAISAALARLSERERRALVAHEVSGRDTRSIGSEVGLTAGAVAAQLNRSRARLRVEYLLALRGADELPTDRCRPVLFAISGGDRRRQRELDAARHVLECDLCAELSQPLLERGQRSENEVWIRVHSDADIVVARKAARDLAGQLNFGRTELTLLATAVSEIARNIVRFAGQGQMYLELLDQPRPGMRIVARDAGPGIDDVGRAMEDGFSTYHGLGLGLPGARRLMDEFELHSEPGRGTTVIMTKWQGRVGR
jgi:serine/threonine-protein kinase RsbT